LRRNFIRRKNRLTTTEKEQQKGYKMAKNAFKTFHDAKITYIIHIACLYFEFFQ